MAVSDILLSLTAQQVSSLAAKALTDILTKQVASKQPEVEVRKPQDQSISALSTKLEEGQPAEDASFSAAKVVEQQVAVLERERNRLAPIATREHWVALAFAVIAGTVFLGGLVLVMLGTIQQAIVTVIASSAPGFLSKVFFSREETIEKRMRQITNDLNQAEQARNKLTLLHQALEIIPEESKAALVERFTKEIF